MHPSAHIDTFARDNLPPAEVQNLRRTDIWAGP